MKEPKRWIVVVLYAVGMAWVESAVVYYLRTMIDRIEPYQPNPLPIIGGLGQVELGREAATLLMLLTVGILAGRSWRSRLGYAAVAFGTWDICYYLFLKVMCGWPHSLTDWDILFLLPLPWWGPVLAPICISFLLIAWGTLASQIDDDVVSEGRFGPLAWGLNGTGMALALYIFMADALRIADQGTDALRNLLPVRFNWPLFIISLVLMSAPILQLCLRFRLARASGMAPIATRNRVWNPEV
jgi:hypothetical protein